MSQSQASTTDRQRSLMRQSTNDLRYAAQPRQSVVASAPRNKDHETASQWRQHKPAGVSSLTRHKSASILSSADLSSTQDEMLGSAHSSARRRKDAVDLFQEYGISRPEGWLSEEDSLNVPPRPLSVTATVQICHSCGSRLPDQTDCSCGHESCLRCTENLIYKLRATVDPSGRSSLADSHGHSQAGHARVGLGEGGVSSHHHTDPRSDAQVSTPRPYGRNNTQQVPKEGHELSERREMIHSGYSRTDVNAPKSVKDNNFIQADHNMKGNALRPQTSPVHAEARPPTRLSDCVPHRHMDEPNGEDPGSDQKSSRHPSIHRNSLKRTTRSSCQRIDSELKELHNEATGIRVNDEALSNHPPLDDPIGGEIDRLFHHGEDLARTGHILGHLAAGSRNVAGSSTTQREGSALTPQHDVSKSSSHDRSHPRLAKTLGHNNAGAIPQQKPSRAGTHGEFVAQRVSHFEPKRKASQVNIHHDQQLHSPIDDEMKDTVYLKHPHESTSDQVEPATNQVSTLSTSSTSPHETIHQRHPPQSEAFKGATKYADASSRTLPIAGGGGGPRKDKNTRHSHCPQPTYHHDETAKSLNRRACSHDPLSAPIHTQPPLKPAPLRPRPSRTEGIPKLERDGIQHIVDNDHQFNHTYTPTLPNKKPPKDPNPEFTESSNLKSDSYSHSHKAERVARELMGESHIHKGHKGHESQPSMLTSTVEAWPSLRPVDKPNLDKPLRDDVDPEPSWVHHSLRRVSRDHGSHENEHDTDGSHPAV